MKPPGRVIPAGFWPLAPWLTGGQILNEKVPLCLKNLGVFSDGETVRETVEDMELFWKELTGLCWPRKNVWIGVIVSELCDTVKEPFPPDSAWGSRTAKMKQCRARRR